MDRTAFLAKLGALLEEYEFGLATEVDTEAKVVKTIEYYINEAEEYHLYNSEVRH